jgi:hypothetical protein
MPETLQYLAEAEAKGVVAAVYRDIRSRLPLVPALFKALARDPQALLEAWLQTRTLYDDAGIGAAAARLCQEARAPVPYRPSPPVREAVLPFAAELPVLCLAVSSLVLTLDGALPRLPLPPLALPPPGPVPEPHVPDRGDDPLFGEIRAVYGTEHVPSMFRSLAARQLLAEPWAALGPYLASDEGRLQAERVRRAAEELARGFPQAAVFSRQEARPLLAQFQAALPRNLIVALACVA